MRWELPTYEMLRPTGVAAILEKDFEASFIVWGKQAEILIFTDFGEEFCTVARS